MICQSCNKELPKGWLFCPTCRTKAGVTPTPLSQPPKAPAANSADADAQSIHLSAQSRHKLQAPLTTKSISEKFNFIRLLIWMIIGSIAAKITNEVLFQVLISGRELSLIRSVIAGFIPAAVLTYCVFGPGRLLRLFK